MEQSRIIRKILKVAAPLPSVLAIILFGSLARGDQGPRSDVDIFVLVDRPEQIAAVRERLAEQELARRIQPVVRTRSHLKKTDPGLLRNLFREGRLLFLNGPLELPAASLLDLKPLGLYVFSLKGLRQPLKARFNRLLYPRKQAGYEYPGLLPKLGGQRLSSGCILIPESGRYRLEQFFKRHRISFRCQQIWM